MTTEKKNILLTGARSMFCLDLARQLHASGHRVFTTETSNWHICRFSNAIRKNYIVPSPRLETEKFIDSLEEIIDREKIDLCIPTFEEIFYVARYLDRLSKKCQVFCADYSTLDGLNNKWKFYEKLKEHALPAPKTFLISSETELKQLPFDVPYILKPCYSRASQKIQKVQPPVPPTQIEVETHNPWVAQEWLEGKKYCSYSVCHKGKVKAHTAYPVNYAIDNSSCLSFTALTHPKILQWVQDFVSKENFTGQIAFDFIETDEDILHVIECNPRSTSGIHLFQAVDRLDRALMNQETTLLEPKAGTAKQISIGMMMYGWRGSAKGQHTMSDYLKQLASVQDVVFCRSDLKPFFSTPFLFSVYLWRSLRMRKRIVSMFTYDIEWNGKLEKQGSSLGYTIPGK